MGHDLVDPVYDEVKGPASKKAKGIELKTMDFDSITSKNNLQGGLGDRQNMPFNYKKQ